MSKLEVLMVSMEQHDFSILEKSKIVTDAVLATQNSSVLCNKMEQRHNASWKLVSTKTKGVGTNRNISLAYATGEYILFMDDDMLCHDGYEKVIIEYFENNPKADVLILNVNTIGEDMKRRQNSSVSRVRYWNFMNYGAVRIACRLSSIKRENIHFNTLFGGGCMYSCGEDTLFLKTCLDAKLKIYTVPYCYADVYQEDSTWYEGVTDKYIYDKGAIFKAMFKRLYIILNIIYSFKISKDNSISFSKVFKLMNKGSNNYENLISYEQSEK